MGTYVEFGELKTWYDEAGEGEPLVLLHGGLSTNETSTDMAVAAV